MVAMIASLGIYPSGFYSLDGPVSCSHLYASCELFQVQTLLSLFIQSAGKTRCKKWYFHWAYWLNIFIVLFFFFFFVTVFFFPFRILKALGNNYFLDSTKNMNALSLTILFSFFLLVSILLLRLFAFDRIQQSQSISLKLPWDNCNSQKVHSDQTYNCAFLFV